MVCGAIDSPSPCLDRPPLPAKIRLSGLRSQPLRHGIAIWDPSRFLGRNWLDGLCIPENAFPKQCAHPEHPPRAVLVTLALTRNQLSWDRYSTWRLLAAVLPRVQPGDDGYASADRVDLHEHEKCALGATHACQFHGLSCRFQCTTCDSRARSNVVRPVWNCSLGRSGNRCQDIRQAVGTDRTLRTACLTLGASAEVRPTLGRGPLQM